MQDYALVLITATFLPPMTAHAIERERWVEETRQPGSAGFRDVFIHQDLRHNTRSSTYRKKQS